jgi:release factor glutamine methyltransferase
MKTGEALSYGRSSLAGASDSPARDAVLLLAHVLESPPEDIYLHPDANMSVELWARYRDLIERRKAGEPVAYLRGFREFMGLTFKTDRRALIPRPETELIVEAFLETFARQPDGPAQPSCTVADLCCGSGVIGLSIAKAMPGAGVILSDVSREAVDLARENAVRLGVAGRVRFLVGDLAEPLIASGTVVDAVVTNPPYIPSGEMASLSREIREFEPRLALDGGAGGLAVISRISREVPRILKPGGYLFMEIGADQFTECSRIFEETGLWRDISVLRDLARRQRVVVGRTRSAE